MPTYTFQRGLVLQQGTSTPAEQGTLGVFRPSMGEPAVPVYDLNDSLLSSGVMVGSFGVHQDFKSDLPYGVLDFGSANLPAVSVEVMAAALQVAVELDDLQARVGELEIGDGGGGGGTNGPQILRADSLALAPPVSVGNILIISPSSNL